MRCCGSGIAVEFVVVLCEVRREEGRKGGREMVNPGEKWRMVLTHTAVVAISLEYKEFPSKTHTFVSALYSALSYL